MAALTNHFLCQSDELMDGERGLRFDYQNQAAFAIRFRGKVYAYVNSCRHVPVELDWKAGDFFDVSRRYLICAVHGALYLPDSGVCISGPCKGRKLAAVPVIEIDGKIFYQNKTSGEHF